MNSINKYRNSKDITIQLNRAEVQKNLLIKKIYKEYEIYFHIVRKSIFTCTENGILSIYSDLPISNKLLSSKDLNIFFKKNISLLIRSKLPFITIEQLNLFEINDLKKQIVNENSFKDLVKLKDSQNVYFDFEDESIAKDNVEFDCDKDSSTYEYYQSLNDDQFPSLNLDTSDFSNSSSEKVSIKKNEEEKNIDTSEIDLIEESNLDKLDDYERINNQIRNVFISSNNLNFFEYIDKSFRNFLLDFSYKVNSELLKINLIEKKISEETFKSLSNNNFIIKHPHPFVIRYDSSFNKLISNKISSFNLDLFNMNNVELEFYSLDLSTCRNKINELKNSFRLLNKKQRYWKHKELSLKNLN